MTTDYAARLDRVVVRRGDFTLGPITLDLPRGYIMGLVGPNGAGKTTTLRALLGMVGVAAGRVEVLGHVAPVPVPTREDIGVVLDHSILVDEWTLGQVESALAPFYARWEPSTYRDLLARFGLSRGARVKELSRGMAVKLQVAVALSHGAQLLLLDEPTSGLDPVAREELVALLGEFLVDDAHSVLFSTHVTTDLERVADLVTFLSEGTIVASGPTDEVRDAYLLVRGDDRELPADGAVRLYGERRTAHGVEAIIDADDGALLSPSVVRERPTLDQLVVHLGGAGAARDLSAGVR